MIDVRGDLNARLDGEQNVLRCRAIEQLRIVFEGNESRMEETIKK
jgi:hypothetical protein